MILSTTIEGGALGLELSRSLGRADKGFCLVAKHASQDLSARGLGNLIDDLDAAEVLVADLFAEKGRGESVAGQSDQLTSSRKQEFGRSTQKQEGGLSAQTETDLVIRHPLHDAILNLLLALTSSILDALERLWEKRHERQRSLACRFVGNAHYTAI